jgi:hypothetical protein
MVDILTLMALIPIALISAAREMALIPNTFYDISLCVGLQEKPEIKRTSLLIEEINNSFASNNCQLKRGIRASVHGPTI